MKTNLFSFIIIVLFFSCNNKKNTSAQILNEQTKDTISQTPDSLGLIPILGYRFVISGDFDGDGNTEKLFEHYISRKDNKETNKFYKNLDDYDELVSITIKKEPLSYLVSDNPDIDTLFVSNGYQHLGLALLRNEGDLDGDPGDEISYIINHADWSSVNNCHVMSYKKGEWVELYTFDVRDWLLPELPGTISDYGLFGLEDKIIVSDDSLNTILENNLLGFEGFIKKISNNKISVIHMNEEAELDTIIVDLQKVKPSDIY